MSQSITYKTKYKSLNSLKKVIDDLAASGAMGKSVEVKSVGEPGFNTGLFRPGPNEDIIFVVRDRDPNSKFFKEGFYEKGFAIARDKKTGEIKIIYDFRYGSDAEKVTKGIREKLERMIEAGDTLNKATKALGQSITKVKKTSDESWEIEGEFTAEEIKNMMAKIGK